MGDKGPSAEAAVSFIQPNFYLFSSYRMQSLAEDA